MTKLPPPVTAQSSQKVLWEELQAANAEIDSQQRELIALRDENFKLRTWLADARLRMTVVHAAMQGLEWKP